MQTVRRSNARLKLVIDQNVLLWSSERQASKLASLILTPSYFTEIKQLELTYGPWERHLAINHQVKIWISNAGVTLPKRNIVYVIGKTLCVLLLFVFWFKWFYSYCGEVDNAWCLRLWVRVMLTVVCILCGCKSSSTVRMLLQFIERIFFKKIIIESKADDVVS